MNAIEQRIYELQQYQPNLTAPGDFEEFWQKVRLEAENSSLESSRRERATLMAGVKVYDVTYRGFAETNIQGIFVVPEHAAKPVPVLVVFPGYTSTKGEPEHYAHWIMKGVAVFAVDVRGQCGETGNSLGTAHGMVKGWITEGILDADRCYYKAIAVDTLRAVLWVAAQEEADKERIGVHGGSQGGGLALLASAWSDHVSVAVADIPNLCHMDFGVLNSTSSLQEVAEFCRRFPEHLSVVLRNISYFDMLNAAWRIKIPILMSVGLKDTVCMPETIFPVFREIGSEQKKLEIYPFSGHEVGSEQQRKAIHFIYDHFFAKGMCG